MIRFFLIIEIKTMIMMMRRRRRRRRRRGEEEEEEEGEEEKKAWDGGGGGGALQLQCSRGGSDKLQCEVTPQSDLCDNLK